MAAKGPENKTARSDQSLSAGPERVQKLLARAGALRLERLEPLGEHRSSTARLV